jgi:hypothetical protein
MAYPAIVDEVYLGRLQKLDPEVDGALDQGEEIERDLKDRIREQLGMPPRATKGDTSLSQHAKNNQISPSYDLPLLKEEHEDGRHTDKNIQTLLLPDELERKLNGISAKCRTWIQESGINVLHAAFGFLEWKDPNSDAVCFSPLVLLPVEFEKKRTREGQEFWVNGRGDEAETNLVLAEKLKLEFGIELPAYRRLHLLLTREGVQVNRKKLYRLYREERLTVRKRGGRKRALGTRAPMTIPQDCNQRWSLDFVSDIS